MASASGSIPNRKRLEIYQASPAPCQTQQGHWPLIVRAHKMVNQIRIDVRPVIEKRGRQGMVL